jgi:hypothetical protein
VKPKYNQNETKYISVYLYLDRSQEIIVKAKYICYKKIRNEVTNRKSASARDYVKENGRYVGWGFHQFIKRDYLLSKTNELLPNNKLTLCFVIEFNDSKTFNYKSLNLTNSLIRLSVISR